MKSLKSLSCALALAAGSVPAAAATVVVHNPLPESRSDALVEVPAPDRPAANWSVRIGDRTVPAQVLNGKIRFTLDLGPHETRRVQLRPAEAPPQAPRVMATLNVQDGGVLHGDSSNGGALAGGVFHLRQSVVVPPDHFIHDGLFGFEGIGFESDRIAYRIYLDQRNVTDVFGKFTTAMVFRKIGLGFDDYQYPRAWGGDIFKVGDSLGDGGVGLLRAGKATQIGPATTITGRVLADGPVTAAVGIDADRMGGGPASVHAVYTLSAGTTVAQVDVAASDLEQPLVTGLSLHPEDQKIVSHPQPGSSWSYIAVWGPQEHGLDCLGTVVLYRTESVDGDPVDDGRTFFVQFRSPTEAHYAFAARWVQENKDVPGARPVRSKAEFEAWLERERTELDAPLQVKAYWKSGREAGEPTRPD